MGISPSTLDSEGMDLEDRVRLSTFKGNWREVIDLYREHSKAHNIQITKSRGTALHVAVTDGREDAVKDLVNAIVKHLKDVEDIRRRKAEEKAVKDEGKQAEAGGDKDDEGHKKGAKDDDQGKAKGGDEITEEGKKEKGIDDEVGKAKGEGDGSTDEEGSEESVYENPLESRNERGDTPLHLAAARGFTSMCKCIIGMNKERSYLIALANDYGETPLFLAALSLHKKAYAYLSGVFKHESRKGGFLSADQHLTRENRDTILHCAIRREDFELARLIIHEYPELGSTVNKAGFTPLKLLATRPSAFKSGSSLAWWKQILYHWIPVKDLVPEDALKSYLKESEDPEHSEELPVPKRYLSCYKIYTQLRDLAVQLGDRAKAIGTHLQILTQGIANNEESHPLEGHRSVDANMLDTDTAKQPSASSVLPTGCCCRVKQPSLLVKELLQITISDPDEDQHVPPNYDTFRQFVKYACMHTLGLLGVGINDIRKMKQKHRCSRQLLSAFMDKPFDSYQGGGDRPYYYDENEESSDLIDEGDPYSVGKKGLADMDKAGDKESGENKEKQTGVKEEDKNVRSHKRVVGIMETPILAAARNGIVEMVNEFQSKIPSTIQETNSDKKNVLLVAVENRQPLVVETLRKHLDEKVWHNLVIGVDNQENTVLHLAAKCLRNKDWQIHGACLQLMWDIKWFEYIKTLAPEHFIFRGNEDENTASEIFRETHKVLVADSSGWLKDTSESCSVVAALIAGVSYATSSTVPGGNNGDTGIPPLQGQPAFDAFAISSLVGLFFSVTALIMFLSILTSRKEAKNFSTDLPKKLLMGLSSLFVSIAAMFVSFCAGHFYVLKDKYRPILFPIYVATCLPVTFYAAAQLPLYIDLLLAIFKKVPRPSDKGDDL